MLDGKVGFEGSTNWSSSGEGTFVVTGHAGGAGYKAQNNTLAVFTDPDTVARFTAELIAEHLVAVDQGGRLGVKKTKSQPTRPAPTRPSVGQSKPTRPRVGQSKTRPGKLKRRIEKPVEAKASGAAAK